VAIGDVLDYRTLVPALEGVDTAYYLVHAMGGGEEGFEARDLYAAQNFGRAAQEAGVRRIIYLGGLGRDEDELSPHLRSRHEVGEQLRSWQVAVTEFRAGVIIGAGSVSFDLVRYLTERVPVLISPRWVSTLTQPIAIEDVLRYLLESLEMPGDGEPRFGDRGPGRVELRADDAQLCEGARVEEVAGAGACVDAQVIVVVGEAGDAVTGECGRAVDRWSEEPGDRGRPVGRAAVRFYATGV
jgi:uncharacterized protein YbjT (DUF2867 family)